METTAAPALLECCAGMSHVGRGRTVGAAPVLGTMLQGLNSHTLSGNTSHKGESTSYVPLGTLVSGLGLDVLDPRLEVGSRVGGEGVGKGDCRAGLRHDGWMGGWMDGWMDG